MNSFDIPVDQLMEAHWNPNQMGQAMLAKLKKSLIKFGLVENLVVRPQREGLYEVLSGNQRLQQIKELGWESVPCVIVDLGDAEARLLAQSLAHIHGQEDLGLRAELMREILDTIPQEQVLEVLPETPASLQAMASLGEVDMAEYLKNFQAAQPAKLRHFNLQFTPAQLEVVEQAIDRFVAAAKEDQGGSPNQRGTALYLLCQYFLDKEDQS